MSNKSVTYAIVKALSDYLKTNVPSLQSVNDDFPIPGQALRMPCASIFTGQPRFMSGSPYVIGKEPDDSGKQKIKRVVGIYEFRLQLDLWCSNKFERHQLQETVFKSLCPYPVLGVNLQLADYHGAWAHYSMTGFTFVDSEESSQRGEWRVRIDLIADVKAIDESLAYTIKSVENNLETPESIPNPQPEQEEESII